MEKEQQVWIQEKLSQEPIVLPGSPFWEVFKVFGRDELLALGINVVGTVGVSKFINDPVLLSLTGPAVEKLGLFVGHFNEAAKIYNTTPEPERKKWTEYATTAIKRGSASLGKDIFAHDPIYALLMYAGLQTYPDTPVWMLSTLSFLIAVGAVTVGEVGVNEARYYAEVAKYKRLGFGFENYFEARFYVQDSAVKELLTDVSVKFNLWKKEKATYHDRYFETKLASFNQRSPIFRLRQREGGTPEHVQTAQIVNTITSQFDKNKPSQFNYFTTKKDKLWTFFKDEMPWTIDEIKNEKLRKLCFKIAKESYYDVYFTRDVVRNPENILISVDNVDSKHSGKFTVIEVKSHPDEKSKRLLIEAMRHIMLNYPVIQTTHSKRILSSGYSV